MSHSAAGRVPAELWEEDEAFCRASVAKSGLKLSYAAETRARQRCRRVMVTKLERAPLALPRLQLQQEDWERRGTLTAPPKTESVTPP